MEGEIDAGIEGEEEQGWKRKGHGERQRERRKTKEKQRARDKDPRRFPGFSRFLSQRLPCPCPSHPSLPLSPSFPSFFPLSLPSLHSFSLSSHLPSLLPPSLPFPPQSSSLLLPSLPPFLPPAEDGRKKKERINREKGNRSLVGSLGR